MYRDIFKFYLYGTILQREGDFLNKIKHGKG